MTKTIDDLSIEELQNRLLEIQEKIKEKEKISLIDQLAHTLRQKETAFIQELLDLALGKKAAIPKTVKPEPIEKKPSKFVGKSEVYLRGGKVFYGIQEVKYTRLDRNGILRISKDGKGLPPKVESLPAHIQRMVLALPQKKEVPPAPKSVASETPVGALQQHKVDEVASSLPDKEPSSELADVEWQDAPDQAFDSIVEDTTSVIEEPNDSIETDPANVDSTPENLVESPEAPIELVQVDLLESTEVQEPPVEPRKRKSKSRPSPESLEMADDDADFKPEPTPKPKKPEFHVLQGSFF